VIEDEHLKRAFVLCGALACFLGGMAYERQFGEQAPTVSASQPIRLPTIEYKIDQISQKVNELVRVNALDECSKLPIPSKGTDPKWRDEAFSQCVASALGLQVAHADAQPATSNVVAEKARAAELESQWAVVPEPSPAPVKCEPGTKLHHFNWVDICASPNVPVEVHTVH